ncbi:MAG: tetratricopeptide repeat protein [Chloroflexi bacterium]|nr:tetratricopeptide repeat protein [Chloroflexota bacterium]
MIELLLQADRLLTVDMVDQAQATYQRVADQDPNNAIAVVGLARCALARGEDRDAYALAARALIIDPENDMARRMEARMAEVLTYRGETLPAVAAVPGRPALGAAVPGTSAAGAAAPVVTPSVASTRSSWLRRIRGR